MKKNTNFAPNLTAISYRHVTDNIANILKNKNNGFN